MYVADYINSGSGGVGAWKMAALRAVASGVRCGNDATLPERALTLIDQVISFGNLGEAIAAELFEISLEEGGSWEANYRRAQIRYILERDQNKFWSGFLDVLVSKFQILPDYLQVQDSGVNLSIPAIIRQCRPDKPQFSGAAESLIGLSRFNKEFQYQCFDNEAAREALSKELSPEICRIYDNIPIPQAKSDFFLLGSTLKSGGVSADVCSVARSSILPFFQTHFDILLVFSETGIRKYFFAAAANSPIIQRHMSRIIRSISGAQASYEFDAYQQVFGDTAFTASLLDCYAESADLHQNYKIALLSEGDYRKIVEPSLEEEDISITESGGLLRAGISRFVDNFELYKEITAVEGVIPAAYVPQYRDVSIVGHDAVPGISTQLKLSMMIPSVGVYRIPNVDVSGHGCMWKDGHLLDLNSYLSKETENEIRGGFWKRPGPDVLADITITEPTVVAFSAGYTTYGHYLVDDLPRLGLVKHFLGEARFSELKFLMPQSTPNWAFALIRVTLNVRQEQFVLFDHATQLVRVKSAIIPEFFHRHYIFHPFLKEFYRSISRISEQPRHRRICLSRKAWEPHKTNQRVFENQAEFEAKAEARGFAIVCPEKLGIDDQMRLMSETICQIGEHGSAQHSSVFSTDGMVVGTLNPLGEVQVNLGRLYNDTNVLVYADTNRVDDKGNTFYSIRSEKIDEFLDRVDDATIEMQREINRKQIAERMHAARSERISAFDNVRG